MIGNDIVDINYSRSQTNWNRLRYQEKVLTLEEQTLLLQASNKEQMFWRLWSMKEAAYKAYVRDIGGRFFDPKTLECKIIDKKFGSVSVKGKVYQTQSNCYLEYVFTLAKSSVHDPTRTRTFDNLIVGSQSKFIHNELLQTIAISRMLQQSDLEIRKNTDGIPSVWDRSNLQIDAISITHCGRYGAFSFIDA